MNEILERKFEKGARVNINGFGGVTEGLAHIKGKNGKLLVFDGGRHWAVEVEESGNWIVDVDDMHVL